MGQKVNPIGFRLSVRRDWQSRWYANKKEFGPNLKEDYQMRSFLALARPLVFVPSPCEPYPPRAFHVTQVQESGSSYSPS